MFMGDLIEEMAMDVLAYYAYGEFNGMCNHDLADCP